MSNSERIDALVATVREINHEIRPKLTNTPGGDPPGNALHTALAQLRDHEYQFSRLIRQMTQSDIAASELTEDAEGVDPERASSRQLLSDFGTAREAILSVLRTLSDEEWSEQRETPDGTRSIAEVIDELLESSKSYVDAVLVAER